MARFKYDANLQHLARWVGSTCHDGLLASEVWGIDWRAPRGAEHPETHPHTRDAVVYAECSSRTLAPGLQLCKECSLAVPLKRHQRVTRLEGQLEQVYPSLCSSNAGNRLRYKKLF
jgi:hypothetical protein